MNFTAITPVTFQEPICILGPILIIISSSDSYDDSIIVGIKTTVSLGCMSIIVEDL